MGTTDARAYNSYCEACDKRILNQVVSGVEVNMSWQMPMRLCVSCGVIDLDLMQFCREVTIGCDQN